MKVNKLDFGLNGLFFLNKFQELYLIAVGSVFSCSYYADSGIYFCTAASVIHMNTLLPCCVCGLCLGHLEAAYIYKDAYCVMNVYVQMSKSVTSVQELGTLANNLTHSYSDLANESCRIARVCPAPQVLIYVKFYSLGCPER